MENKLYATTKRKKENIINLFPNYFKKIGIALMLLGFIPAGIISQVDLALVKVIPKDVVKLITIDLFLLGLLFVAWAKDKVEDEMTMLMRLKAIEWTFMYAIIYVIIEPIFYKLLDTDAIENINTKGLVVMMLMVYLIQYYIQKRAR
jgi:hypothetical protein